MVCDAKIEELYVSLKELTNVDKATKSAHIENIEKKYKTSNENVDNYVGNDESSLLCPQCGSKLVLRTAKKGENAGNQFYGCSAFPKCRYVQNVERGK